MDYRWAAGDVSRFHRYAEELLALAPDVILASATPSVQALQRATRTVPIVFVSVTDPVGAGFVQSLARPGGNTTGFLQFEFGLSGKFLEVRVERSSQRVVLVLNGIHGPVQWRDLQTGGAVLPPGGRDHPVTSNLSTWQ
jgi:putative ABC transport system substrate-binding protein